MEKTLIPWRRRRSTLITPILLSLMALCVSSSQASTFERMSLEKLTRNHSTVMVGKVVDSFSYWNEDATAILTEVTIERESMLKGTPDKASHTTLTLMGGEVDGLRQVILGGAALQLGESYVLFIAPSDLPGARGVETIPGHSQGVFEISLGGDGELRATSQARSMHLEADGSGLKSAPGGFDGFSFDQFLRTVSGVAEAQKNEAQKDEVNK